ncbi:hypothetical protein EYF80_039256 [Liparis tanakae]|uniref:Uncharacterized protein n=1 Tax=Liparis tanakae TaxID=230148 RepID=A0A4Z2GCX5_9TELE|nr:hypothetical protein EYF80_039256 [Liparis tanakae]
MSVEVIVLTVGVAVGDQELQHLVHGAHEEDEPQLGHRHDGQQTINDLSDSPANEPQWARSISVHQDPQG